MKDREAGVNHLFLREEELRKALKMFFFAYRDMLADADALLAGAGLGRDHHRIVSFLAGRRSVPMADLLLVMKTSKQNLSRLLSPLLRQGYIEQKSGTRDRRQRLLQLTAKGEALERTLSKAQHRRVAAAYRAAGVVAVEGFQKVMLGLIDEENRRRIASI